MTRDRKTLCDLCVWKTVMKGGDDMKRFMIPRIAHCKEGCPILSWV
jgi:hypothetical protein